MVAWLLVLEGAGFLLLAVLYLVSLSPGLKNKSDPDVQHKVVHNLVTLYTNKNNTEDFDKAAEDLRLATRHLGMIVGKVDVEEILGSIFSDFCIGK